MFVLVGLLGAVGIGQALWLAEGLESEEGQDNVPDRAVVFVFVCLKVSVTMSAE